MVEAQPSKRRKREPRFDEIALEAGVSLSTVNRVLNEHGSASESARNKVIAAARKLGIKRILPDAYHGLIHIDVVITQSSEPFSKRLFAAVHRVAQMLDRRVVVHRLLVKDEEGAIINSLRSEKHRRTVIITMIPESGRVSETLQKLIDEGVIVITLVSDIDQAARSYYAGINNYQAAATAAWFIQRVCRDPGQVLKLMAHEHYVVHKQRNSGFDDSIAKGPHLWVRAVTTLEHAGTCYRAVKQALLQGDLRAIYNSGSGSEGVYAALREADMLGKVVWVGHELYDHHNQYLASGAMDLVIDQDPDAQVVAAMQYALFACGLISACPPRDLVNFRLFCEANRSDTHYVV